MTEEKKELTLSDIDNKLNEVLEYLKVLCPEYEEQKKKIEEEKAEKKRQEEYLKYLKTNYISVNIPQYVDIIKVTKYTLITFLNRHLKPIHYYQLKTYKYINELVEKIENKETTYIDLSSVPRIYSIEKWELKDLGIKL